MPPAGLVMKQPCFVSLSHHATCPPSPALRHQSLFYSDTFAVSGGITITDYRALDVYPKDWGRKPADCWAVYCKKKMKTALVKIAFEISWNVRVSTSFVQNELQPLGKQQVKAKKSNTSCCMECGWYFLLFMYSMNVVWYLGWHLHSVTSVAAWQQRDTPHLHDVIENCAYHLNDPSYTATHKTVSTWLQKINHTDWFIFSFLTLWSSTHLTLK